MLRQMLQGVNRTIRSKLQPRPHPPSKLVLQFGLAIAGPTQPKRSDMGRNIPTCELRVLNLF